MKKIEVTMCEGLIFSIKLDKGIYIETFDYDIKKYHKEIIEVDKNNIPCRCINWVKPNNKGKFDDKVVIHIRNKKMFVEECPKHIEIEKKDIEKRAKK